MEPGLHLSHLRTRALEPVDKLYTLWELMGADFNRSITALWRALLKSTFHRTEITSFSRMTTRREDTFSLLIFLPCNSTCFRFPTYRWIGGGWRHRGGDKIFFEVKSQRSCLWLF